MVTDYMVRTLIERRQIIAHHWLKDVNPIGNFILDVGTGGTVLRFDDFMVDHDLEGPAEYRYEMTMLPVAEGDRRRERGTTMLTRIPLGQALGTESSVRIWTTRGKGSSRPVTVYVRNKPGDASRICRIERS